MSVLKLNPCLPGNFRMSSLATRSQARMVRQVAVQENTRRLPVTVREELNMAPKSDHRQDLEKYLSWSALRAR